jgi:secondary thiamine-phosphate synthase enzyme
MKKIEIITRQRTEFIDITRSIQDVVSEQKTGEGICLIFNPHTTAALTINENADPDVVSDIIDYLEKIVPKNAGYIHTEGNSDAHIKSSLIGCNITIPVVKGRLSLGTWQGIYFCEFDGPRTRNVYVTVV